MITIIYYNSMHLFQKETITDFTEFESFKPEVQKTEEIKKDTFFVFNPNKINDEQWRLLGLSEKQISTFRNYQERGVTFYNEKDLLKCYAISEEFIDRFSGYIIFPKKEDKGKSIKEKKTIKKKIQIIEINNADSLELILIKGIGPFYAKQIIKYRNKLGGFISYDQFSEVWRLEKLDLHNFRKQTILDTTTIVKININNCTSEQLWNHPYVNYKIANAIVNYRGQHGEYKNIKDIQEIVLIDSQLFRKIAPYLRTSD
ncbi:MAG: helix-hairpin-helix domain-containing protein [Flavobacteriales bacterium]|nr:helix-hairpin-helix domain-containing protein [Flavobacteriales bacterium]